jgi:hypothetical protein
MKPLGPIAIDLAAKDMFDIDRWCGVSPMRIGRAGNLCLSKRNPRQNHPGKKTEANP